MSKTRINYLFPPEKINDLLAWHFILHFPYPLFWGKQKLLKANNLLARAEWKIVQFTEAGINQYIQLNLGKRIVSINIDVTENERYNEGSLSKYESDVWKILGIMAECGFSGDVYYEAVDWNEKEKS
jgi:hypothetical protein